MVAYSMMSCQLAPALTISEAALAQGIGSAPGADSVILAVAVVEPTIVPPTVVPAVEPTAVPEAPVVAAQPTAAPVVLPRIGFANRPCF